MFQVLLRALRDFNLGKLTSDDTGIFLGLLNDLFPRTLELVPRAIDHVFETQCRKSARELKFQADDMFSLKISQVSLLYLLLCSLPLCRISSPQFPWYFLVIARALCFPSSQP